MIFPLRLTPFEEYMFWDDRPEYPMAAFFRLRFSGRLDGPTLESAMQATVARHPLTRCKVARVGRKLCWVPDDDFLPVLEPFKAGEGREYPEVTWIDLTARPGTRCWLVERNGAHELVVQMHHSATDALGISQFIGDLLVDYARRAGLISADVESRPLDPSLLPARNRFGLTWRNFPRILPPLSMVLRGVLQALKHEPTPMLPERIPANAVSMDAAAFPSTRTEPFSEAETQQILATAKRLRCTVNDLLARDLFLAVGDLRRRAGRESPDDWLRFAMPVNLRRPGDERLSTSNVVSMVFLDRRPSDLANPEHLLQSIQRQMQFIKRHRLAMTFVMSLAVAQRIPGCIRRNLRRDSCWATSVFSNLGVILTDVPLPRREGRIALGDVTLDELDFIAPTRLRTSVICCVCTYAGRLFVMLHWDPRVLSREQANSLMAGCFEKIRTSIRQNAGTNLPRPAIPEEPACLVKQ